MLSTVIFLQVRRDWTNGKIGENRKASFEGVDHTMSPSFDVEQLHQHV